MLWNTGSPAFAGDDDSESCNGTAERVPSPFPSSLAKASLAIEIKQPLDICVDAFEIGQRKRRLEDTLHTDAVDRLDFQFAAECLHPCVAIQFGLDSPFGEHGLMTLHKPIDIHAC